MPVIYVVFESMSVMMAVRQHLQCLFLMDCAILFLNVLQMDSILYQQTAYVLYLSIVLTHVTFEKIFLKYKSIFHTPSFVQSS